MLYIIDGKPLRGQDYEKKYLQISYFQILAVGYMLIFGFAPMLATASIALFTGRVLGLLFPKETDLNPLEEVEQMRSQMYEMGMDPDIVTGYIKFIKNFLYAYIKLEK